MGCVSSQSKDADSSKKFAMRGSIYDKSRSSDVIGGTNELTVSEKCHTSSDTNELSHHQTSSATNELTVSEKQPTSAKEIRKEQEKIRDSLMNEAINDAAKEAQKKADEEKKDKEKIKEDEKKTTSWGFSTTKKEEVIKTEEPAEQKEIVDEKKIVDQGPVIPTRCVGYLLKQGGTIKTWKKRFFILEKGVLIYYQSESSPGSNEGVDEKGRIILAASDKIAIIDEKKGKLMLSSSVRELPMIVDNKELAEAWREAIEKHISYIIEKEKFIENQQST